MAKLTTVARKKIPKNEFGLPGEKKYPMPDRAHAGNAKARATQMVKAGKLSLGRRKFIDFALCLIHEPEIIFLDEPTANLDATSMGIMLDAIQYLSEKKQMSFLIATNESDHFNGFISNEILINQVNANY